MFLDPAKLTEVSPPEILESAASGHLGLDHRFINALVTRREEALSAVIEFARQDRSNFPVDIEQDLISLIRFWKAPEGVPFLIEYIREVPEEVPDEVIETLVEIGQPALEPLLALYEDLEESESGEVAFTLASLRVRDERILKILVGRMEYDLADSIFLLTLYGDPAAIQVIEAALAELDTSDVELRREAQDAVETLGKVAPALDEQEPFDILDEYPETADLPIELLDEDERADLLDHPIPALRAAAASAFFNRELSHEVRTKLTQLATSDESTTVRARAWEALTDATEDVEVVEAMLTAMRDPNLPIEERGGLMVGLAPEMDRNEVRQALVALYEQPEGRAKALEAMWRSVHPSFSDFFAKHLDDTALEVRRGAIWGVGYYGLKGELDRVRKLFDDEDLRSDALFAYSLATPADVSRGRMKGLLKRIDEEARGLSDIEEELVKAALDERLILAGKEPYFAQQQD